MRVMPTRTRPCNAPPSVILGPVLGDRSQIQRGPTFGTSLTSQRDIFIANLLAEPRRDPVATPVAVPPAPPIARVFTCDGLASHPGQGWLAGTQRNAAQIGWRRTSD